MLAASIGDLRLNESCLQWVAEKSPLQILQPSNLLLSSALLVGVKFFLLSDSVLFECVVVVFFYIFNSLIFICLFFSKLLVLAWLGKVLTWIRVKEEPQVHMYKILKGSFISARYQLIATVPVWVDFIGLVVFITSSNILRLCTCYLLLGSPPLSWRPVFFSPVLAVTVSENASFLGCVVSKRSLLSF